uniref:protein PHLOEM PROTEIN 2-LIKE A10-like n=1 Tax=Erigeron canadensis TaxID=72917 RepID=UPI001CB97033|nr:protein PHLOEM PROTEIN 2-LIKE A10-like [Erigeron canadensis]
MTMLTKSYQITPRNRKWVMLLALCGLSSYGMYKVYNLPCVSRKRKRFAKLLGSLIVITEMISDSTDILSVVSRDLKTFLTSDQDQIPNSMKQLTKIAVSNEFSSSLSRVFEGATLGVVKGSFEIEKDNKEVAETSRLKDNVIEKLMSQSGTGFVSVVVGSFARNLVLGFYSSGKCESGSKLATYLDEWVGVLSTEKTKVVIGDLIKTIVSTVVAVYLDRPTSMNVYDNILSGLADSKYQKRIKDVLVYVSNGAVETFIKTSHQVLTS